MTVEAIWSDLEPGTVLSKDLHEQVLATRPDVQVFVQRLALPDTSEAQLIHSARPLETDSVTGRTIPDHQVIVAVCDGFGYIEYAGEDDFVQSVGSPDSPGWTTTASNYFHPGTGVPLTTLVDLIDEFRTTAARPTSVRWRDVLGG
ncbi:Imm1 family immunity protein [Saccharothrix sp. HUAS TT1]|uniref:Imm1 family immunity protein n=1 Tax=unclassified Saccharothrix TaxID=2593673 RepID=UPI00345BC2DD